MLCLGRKPGEKILIGDDIEILVIRATDTYVRLGIKAPKGVTILREELFLRDQQEGEKFNAD